MAGLAGRRLRPDAGSDADARQPGYRANVSAGESEPGGVLPIARRAYAARGFDRPFSRSRWSTARRYGYRRVTKELRRRGMQVNHKRVARIMREDNLLAVQPKRFVITTDSTPCALQPQCYSIAYLRDSLRCCCPCWHPPRPGITSRTMRARAKI